MQSLKLKQLLKKLNQNKLKMTQLRLLRQVMAFQAYLQVSPVTPPLLNQLLQQKKHQLPLQQKKKREI